MKLYFRDLAVILFAPISWALYIVAVAPLYVLGYPIVAALIVFRQYTWRQSYFWPYAILTWKPRWAYLWGNEEDGVDGTRGYVKWPGTDQWQNAWWIEKMANWGTWGRMLVWSAYRNPICNARFIKPLGFKINRGEIAWTGNSPLPRETTKTTWVPQWFLCAHGWYSGFYFAWRKVYFRIGWNVFPGDANPDDGLGYRAYGAGFKLQLGRIK